MSVPLRMHVSIPHDWNDAAIKLFADTENYCGIPGGWILCKTGDPLLRGTPERIPAPGRDKYVSVLLEA